VEFKVEWTDLALNDLIAIHRYISRDSSQAADNVCDEIIAHVGLLKAHPLLGSVYERDLMARARQIIVGRYRVFYRVNGHTQRFEILTVRHGARREPKL
jgi:toxin ParE1/3/4